MFWSRAATLSFIPNFLIRTASTPTTEIPHVREYTPNELREAVEAAGFEIENLFTDVIPGYGTDIWVKDFLERNQYPTTLRGEQMYCLAKKRTGRKTVRYPHFLYEGC